METKRTFSEHLNQGPLIEPNLLHKTLTQSQEVSRGKFTPMTQIAADYSVPSIINVGLLHPESAFHIAWEVLALTFILYQAVLIPFTICFSLSETGPVAYVEFGITVFFLLDICTL